MTDKKLMQQALNALEQVAEYFNVDSTETKTIIALRERLTQPDPVPYWHNEFLKHNTTSEQPAQQEPVACAVCNEVHTILDTDESKIIRNAADGYPEGRTPRVLTLQERVIALCVYAADWKRWCIEKENASPAQQQDMPKIGCVNHDCDKCKAQPQQEPDYKALWKQMCERCDELDAKLAQQQEPVAWTDLLKKADEIVRGKIVWKRFIDGTPLANDIAVWMADFAQKHTSPPASKPWVGLTAKETVQLWNDVQGDDIGGADRFARAIEAKLREKNS